MKKQTLILLAVIIAFFSIQLFTFTACSKKKGSGVDSGTIYFHLHTQVNDSTIGGNPGPDSTSWAFDSNGRYILLTVPQFFISYIQLVNANGEIYNMTNAVLLKGLDSEDYYVGKAPVGTYVSVNFWVGLSSLDNALPYSEQLITDKNYYPLQSSMENGNNGYFSIIIKGMYDSSSHPGNINSSPLASAYFPFSYEIPNSMTNYIEIKLPSRGAAAFPDYVLLAGGTQYVHLLCDYGRLLYPVNYITQPNTDGATNIAVADSIVSHINDFFRYEQ